MERVTESELQYLLKSLGEKIRVPVCSQGGAKVGEVFLDHLTSCGGWAIMRKEKTGISHWIPGRYSAKEMAQQLRFSLDVLHHQSKEGEVGA